MTTQDNQLDELTAVSREQGFCRGMAFMMRLVERVGLNAAAHKYKDILTVEGESSRIAALSIEAAHAEVLTYPPIRAAKATATAAPLKITVEPTGYFQMINGTDCRMWKGNTAAGTDVEMYVAMVKSPIEQDASELDASLREIKVERRLVSFDYRMVM